MWRLLLTLFLLSLAVPASAQIYLLNDEFNDASTLADWSRFYATEGWPDRMRVVDINTTSPGALYLEPTSTGWYNDLHAPFLFKMVDGDFCVEARVMSQGIAGALPATTYSLAGLFVRAPRAITKAIWTAGNENWLFFSVGVGNDPSTYSFEDKTTTNSLSTLIVTPTPQGGWVRLRITRQGAMFTLEYRFSPGDPWTLHRVFNRGDLPNDVQVGLTAYSDWPTVASFVGDPMTGNCQVLDVNADLRTHVDYIRFSRPTPSGIGDAPQAGGIRLDQNVPNPFNPVTRIAYDIGMASRVELAIFDAAGRRIRTLLDEYVEPQSGGFTVMWDGRNDRGAAVASGVYYYRVTAAGRAATRKLILLK